MAETGESPPDPREAIEAEWFNGNIAEDCRDRLLAALDATASGQPTTDPADRCTCANDGSAVRCPHHTQADFDSASRTTDPADGLSDDGPPDDRLLAMVRRSLVQTRPMTEVDAICETLQRRLAARLRSARPYHWPQDEPWYAAERPAQQEGASQ